MQSISKRPVRPLASAQQSLPERWAGWQGWELIHQHPLSRLLAEVSMNMLGGHTDRTLYTAAWAADIL